MADFKLALPRILQAEGGYTDNPDDNGNWTGGVKGKGELVGTNYGITAEDMAIQLGHTPVKEDMKNMSVGMAEFIYRRKYWNIIRGDEITSQDEANQIIDEAINAGIKTAIKMAQDVLELPQTGIMDDTTLNKLNNKT